MEGEWTDDGGYDLITVPKVIANCDADSDGALLADSKPSMVNL